MPKGIDYVHKCNSEGGLGIFERVEISLFPVVQKGKLDGRPLVDIVGRGCIERAEAR